MAIRICTLGVPGFRHDGLIVGERWTPFDPEADKVELARNALRDYHGRFVQVHPEDRDKLPDELGLKFVEPSEPLADVPRKPLREKRGNDKNNPNDAPPGGKKD